MDQKATVTQEVYCDNSLNRYRKGCNPMTTAQLLAADPKVSAWVAASAGTGKTKVLVDRLLNLLLAGFGPEQILCLTFTKAAAAEMSNRFMQRLALWATLPIQDLKNDLKKLLGDTALNPLQITRARQLFSIVLDVAGGMKIQTIHGFCQSILNRFPLEAGISPHFRIADDIQVEEMLSMAERTVFANTTPIVEAALAILNPHINDSRFSAILKDFYHYRVRIMSLLDRHESIENYGKALLNFLNLEEFVNDPKKILEPDLIVRMKAQKIPQGVVDFDTYINTYLTQKREIRKKLLPEELPQAQHVYQLVQSLSALEITQQTVAFLVLVQEILTLYQEYKTRRCILDYDDLIQQTQKLFMQPGVASWVLYKLEGGIDHLLIDEAQDTNAAQWEIILKLTSEFFTCDKPYRTIFAVGDAKQSIYSFQGANPKEFLRLKTHFAQLAQSTGQGWCEVQLDLSYRSTAAILAVVDGVFAHKDNHKGVLFEGSDMTHHVFRRSCLPGIVQLWPLVTAEREAEQEIKGKWHLPLERKKSLSPQARLACYLAEQIEGWLTSEMVLPSTNQPIQPKDILILVRKRSELVFEMIRALKKRHILVAGADRLILTDHIAAMDLIALGHFVLLPEDDLNLACVLRSPLIGLSEEDLFILAHDRQETLWQSLSQKASLNPVFEQAYSWLKSCLRKADLTPVYEFYSWILTQREGRHRFLSRLGNEVDDVLEEFLNQALNYDQDHVNSLQGFIHFMQNQSQEIKRDSSDSSHNHIRIMTVHGSKGLQAPVVILPDSAESGKSKVESLLWGDHLVLLRPNQLYDTPETKTLKAKGDEELEHEGRRLLYVALTRAQDHLYVGGWISGKEISENCWYRVIQKALGIESQIPPHLDPKTPEQSSEISIEKACLKKPPLPAWANTPLENVKIKTGIHKKERSSMPAAGRGILLHRFFECLPQIPEEQRYYVACQIIEKAGETIQEWENDIQATLKILTDTLFKDIFGPESLAEVPISGRIDGIPFHGRIDRLLVRSDTLTIVDYKTSPNPPLRLKDVPEAYIKQLEGYATALRTIYPHHQIQKILLWTAGPLLQLIE